MDKKNEVADAVEKTAASTGDISCVEKNPTSNVEKEKAYKGTWRQEDYDSCLITMF